MESMKHSMHMTPRKADLILLLLAMVWGSGYTVTKIAVLVTSPVQFLTYRFVLSAFLAFVFFRKRFVAATMGDWIAGTIIGVCLAFGMLLQTLGLQYTDAGKAVFIASAFVVMVPFFFWAMTKERPQLRIVLACLLMLAGLAMMAIGPEGLTGWNPGDTLVLISAVGFALHMALIGVHAPKRDPLLLAGIQFTVCSAVFLIFSIFDTERQPITLEAGFAILYAAIVITFICFVVQLFCQKYTSPSRAAILINLETVFGTIIAVLTLGESYTGTMLLSFVVIFAAVLIAELDWKDWRGWKTKKKNGKPTDQNNLAKSD